jgi:DNA-binding PucR family transcriptional regulator
LEERTGRSLSDPRAVAELSIALEVERRGNPEREDGSVPV